MKLSISMTRREVLLGWTYLLISQFVLPFAIGLLNVLFPNPLSDAEINLIYFGINFIVTALIFRGFLYASFLEAKENLRKCLKFALLGFLIYRVGAISFAVIAALLQPDFSNVNDQAIGGMLEEFPVLLRLATIFLVPISEELLYRGLLFQGLQRKSRLLAYCVSAGVFASIHVLGYIGWYDPLTLVLCYIQYLPAAIALAWAYEKSDTIITPMLMHIVVNYIGISAMR